MDHPKSDRRDERGLDANPDVARKVDLKAKLLAVLDQAEGYRVLAIRSRDRGERDFHEHIVELYVKDRGGTGNNARRVGRRSWSQANRVRFYPDCWPRPQTPGALIVLTGLMGSFAGTALLRVPDDQLKPKPMREPKSPFRVLTESGPLVALTVAVALLVGIAGPASAQFFNFGARETRNGTGAPHSGAW